MKAEWKIKEDEGESNVAPLTKPTSIDKKQTKKNHLSLRKIIFSWMAFTIPSSFLSSNSTPYKYACQICVIRLRRKREKNKLKSHLRTDKRNRLLKLLTSIFSFLATESQSFAVIPIFQSMSIVLPAPSSWFPSSQKQATWAPLSLVVNADWPLVTFSC